MNLDDLLKHSSEWLRGTGPDSEIVMSSRVRLARNLKKLPFVVRANDGSRKNVRDTVHAAIQQCASLQRTWFVELDQINEIDRHFLVERHLVSREHVANPAFRAVVIGAGEMISIMVNEEDHLRIQVIQSGLNLENAWELIDSIDNELARVLEFAYSNEWGYLTCCPTNTGTGLRGSVMLHLPALVMTKQINKVLHTITKLGLAARGFYGEGTEATGNFFQISNQVTLGRTEVELIENIQRIIMQVIEHEQTAREALLTQNREQLEDRVWRSFGILQNARIIASQEALDLFSSVRLGIDLNILGGLSRERFNELFLYTQPAHLQKIHKKVLSSKERDIMRAELIRKRLSNLK
jgi:protein arginine kinase